MVLNDLFMHRLQTYIVFCFDRTMCASASLHSNRYGNLILSQKVFVIYACVIGTNRRISALQVRDLMSWAHETEREMLAEKPVRDVHSVDMLKARHEELKAEIDARDETFVTIGQTGEAMVQDDHYAKDDVSVKSNHLCDLHGTELVLDSLSPCNNIA